MNSAAIDLKSKQEYDSEFNFDEFQFVDSISTNVMIADKDFNLVYVNPKSKLTLKTLESEIMAEFGVAFEDLVGGSIDRFHKNGKDLEIRKLLTNKSIFPYRKKISFAGKVLDLNVNIVEKEGAISHYVVNWEDITEKEEFDRLAFKLNNMMDSLPINVMAIDLDRKLNYMNPKSVETLKTLQSLIPIPVEQMIGQSIDQFHKDPEMQKKLLADPKNLPHRSTIKLGEESLDLNVTPVFDKDGKYEGAMASWSVISDNVNVASQIKELHEVVVESTATLETISHSIAAGAEETSKQAQSVATSSEQASRNVESVAAASEEMSKSIREISDQVHNGSKKAQQAASDVQDANTKMGSLSAASDEIGQVVKVIASIAQQTNLLALNATIEAARAGEAGKGFAVVANEVKELARQTAKATEEIEKKISGIQKETEGAVGAISEINVVIEELKELNMNVAAAIEEQSAATKEISRNVLEATQGTKEVSQNITHVSEVADDSQKYSNSLLDASGRMKEVSEMVSKVKEFLTSLGW